MISFNLHNTKADMTEVFHKEIKTLRGMVYDGKILPFELAINSCTEKELDFCLRFPEEKRTRAHMARYADRMVKKYQKMTGTRSSCGLQIEFQGEDPCMNAVTYYIIDGND